MSKCPLPSQVFSLMVSNMECLKVIFDYPLMFVFLALVINILYEVLILRLIDELLHAEVTVCFFKTEHSSQWIYTTGCQVNIMDTAKTFMQECTASSCFLM